MKKKMLRSKWGVEIEGHYEDKTNLEKKINDIISVEEDFFVTRIDTCFVLRTERWNNAKGPNEVIAIAESDVRLLRSCLDVLDGCGRMYVGTIFEFDKDGNIVTRTRDTELTIRVRKSQKNLSSPKDFQSLMVSAFAHEKMRDALEDYQYGANWFEIYKSLEAITALFGGESKALDYFKTKSSDIKNLKRTANESRHTSRMFIRVKNAMDKKDGLNLLREIIVETSNKLNKDRRWSPRKAKYIFQLEHKISDGSEAASLKRLFPAGTRLTLSEDAPPGTPINEIDP